MKYETLPVIDAMMDPSLSASTTQELTTALNQGKKNSFNISKFFKYPPSIAEWHTVDTTATTVTILSMSVDHHADSPWYIPALHDKYSIGWNRTREYGFSTRPYACSLRFFGIALESVLEGYQQGGNGYLTVGFVSDQQRQMWHGFDKNETNKLYCYYITNKDTGSEFIDKPKTLGVAINCPVLLDEEMGPFIFQHTLQFGKYCRPFAEYPVTVEIHLRPSSYRQQSTDANNNKEIIADFRSNPSEIRTVKMKEMSLTTPMSENRPHAVCTVQTFRNPYSGAMLYAFVKYYQLLGWRVIIYDRFGFHYQYLRELISLPGVDYYPFTVFQLANPSKYNKDYILQQGIDLKIFYQMEKNWGYTKGAKLADTADQDADKTRTYDYARLEYRHLDSILYLDSDEFFFCPQASQSVQAQRIYQQKIHHEFIARGIEEMRYVRIPYSGLAPPGFVNSPQNRSTIDFTEHTSRCMHQAYERKNLYELMACWSKGSSYDNFAKSADMAGVCPFHYNHWSCDGMKGGGRDWTKVRCRCKVALDMQNFYEYRPILKRCHIMHFNDNKYRFQARRSKHQYDRGDITAINPIAVLLGNDRSWNQPVINESNHHSNSSSTHH